MATTKTAKKAAGTRPRGRDGASRRSRHVMHRDAVEDAAEANPLRAGTRLERVPDPAIVVVFGATGDLSHRKILPAFYNLRRAGLLPTETSIVGYSRRPYTDAAFSAEMKQAVVDGGHHGGAVDPLRGRRNPEHGVGTHRQPGALPGSRRGKPRQGMTIDHASTQRKR